MKPLIDRSSKQSVKECKVDSIKQDECCIPGLKCDINNLSHLCCVQELICKSHIYMRPVTVPKPNETSEQNTKDEDNKLSETCNQILWNLITSRGPENWKLRRINDETLELKINDSGLVLKCNSILNNLENSQLENQNGFQKLLNEVNDIFRKTPRSVNQIDKQSLCSNKNENSVPKVFEREISKNIQVNSNYCMNTLRPIKVICSEGYSQPSEDSNSSIITQNEDPINRISIANTTEFPQKVYEMQDGHCIKFDNINDFKEYMTKQMTIKEKNNMNMPSENHTGIEDLHQEEKYKSAGLVGGIQNEGIIQTVCSSKPYNTNVFDPYNYYPGDDYFLDGSNMHMGRVEIMQNYRKYHAQFPNTELIWVAAPSTGYPAKNVSSANVSQTDAPPIIVPLLIVNPTDIPPTMIPTTNESATCVPVTYIAPTINDPTTYPHMTNLPATYISPTNVPLINVPTTFHIHSTNIHSTNGPPITVPPIFNVPPTNVPPTFNFPPITMLPTNVPHTNVPHINVPLKSNVCPTNVLSTTVIPTNVSATNVSMANLTWEEIPLMQEKLLLDDSRINNGMFVGLNQQINIDYEVRYPHSKCRSRISKRNKTHSRVNKSKVKQQKKSNTNVWPDKQQQLVKKKDNGLDLSITSFPRLKSIGNIDTEYSISLSNDIDSYSGILKKTVGRIELIREPIKRRTHEKLYENPKIEENKSNINTNFDKNLEITPKNINTPNIPLDHQEGVLTNNFIKSGDQNTEEMYSTNNSKISGTKFYEKCMSPKLHLVINGKNSHKQNNQSIDFQKDSVSVLKQHLKRDVEITKLTKGVNVNSPQEESIELKKLKEDPHRRYIEKNIANCNKVGIIVHNKEPPNKLELIQNKVCKINSQITTNGIVKLIDYISKIPLVKAKPESRLDGNNDEVNKLQEWKTIHRKHRSSKKFPNKVYILECSPQRDIRNLPKTNHKDSFQEEKTNEYMSIMPTCEDNLKNIESISTLHKLCEDQVQNLQKNKVSSYHDNTFTVVKENDICFREKLIAECNAELSKSAKNGKTSRVKGKQNSSTKIKNEIKSKKSNKCSKLDKCLKTAKLPKCKRVKCIFEQDSKDATHDKNIGEIKKAPLTNNTLDKNTKEAKNNEDRITNKAKTRDQILRGVVRYLSFQAEVRKHNIKQSLDLSNLNKTILLDRQKVVGLKTKLSMCDKKCQNLNAEDTLMNNDLSNIVSDFVMIRRRVKKKLITENLLFFSIKCYLEVELYEKLHKIISENKHAPTDCTYTCLTVEAKNDVMMSMKFFDQFLSYQSMLVPTIIATVNNYGFFLTGSSVFDSSTKNDDAIQIQKVSIHRQITLKDTDLDLLIINLNTLITGVPDDFVRTRLFSVMNIIMKEINSRLD